MNKLIITVMAGIVTLVLIGRVLVKNKDGIVIRSNEASISQTLNTLSKNSL